MELKKPLIIVKPLTESLNLLHEAAAELAEEEGFEIYITESVEEASQLIPTIGPSLSLLASPKKTAQLLKNNRNYLKIQVH